MVLGKTEVFGDFMFFIITSNSPGCQHNPKVECGQTTMPASVQKTRYVSPTPDRILDAPEVQNDFCKFWRTFPSLADAVACKLTKQCIWFL